MTNIVETKYWHKIDDGRIQCDACPRHCKLHNGQLGLCSVRGAANDQIYLLSYGQASGFCIDPIEKKPLNHFLPGTPVLSFGQTGCNLTCRFCQNHTISKVREGQLQLDLEVIQNGQYTVNSQNDRNFIELKQIDTDSKFSQNWDISKSREFDKLQALASPEMIANAAVQTGCRSVAFTYNDPVIFLEYAIDVARACHAVGVKTVAVTAGYMTPEPRKEFFEHIDAANVDLKAFTEDFYRNVCSSELAKVLETLVYLKHETNVWFEITNLIIPGENDSDDEIDQMTRWVVENLGPDVPMHFSAFHPDWKMLDKPRTPKEVLVNARRIALGNGVRFAYTGNVHDKPGASTYCPSCGDVLIGRDWYELSEWNLSFDGNYSGNCTKCGTLPAGVFDGPPGTWGRKRVPIKFDAP